ncbi:copper homeostasis membrane protein CopD [Rhizobium binxianense]
MTGPDAALVFCRFLLDGAALFLWGACAYLRVLVPEDLRRETWARLGVLRKIAVACVAATTVAMLPLRAAIIGNGWRDALDPGTLSAVLLETTVGTAWLCQAAAAVLLLGAGILPGRFHMAATASASALVLASLAVTGHAAMNGGWLGIAHQANDIVHLLAGGAWIGALLPVLLILPHLKDRQRGSQARTALIRFSTAGHVAVALVILSGVANMLLILDGLPTNWTFGYQRLLALKIRLVAAMTAIAVVNRYVFVPRMSRSAGSPRALACGTVAEIVLALAVIGLVAWFGMLEPT